MGRRLVIVALVAAGLGATAPSASARCAHPEPLVCFVQCTTAQLLGAQCKDAS
jgi:hypothetical protein